MSLILHSFRRCPFAIRVRMTLEEKGLSYQIIEEKLSNPSPELLARHPQGLVPLLIVRNSDQAEQIIYQSSIITEYLDETYSVPQFMPPSPELRATVRLWTYWCDQIFKPDLDRFKYELPSLPETERVDLFNRLEHHLEKWNTALRGNPYLLGEQMTLADIHLFPFARQFAAIRPPFERLNEFTELARWLDHMLNRPAFSRVMAK